MSHSYRLHLSVTILIKSVYIFVCCPTRHICFCTFSAICFFLLFFFFDNIFHPASQQFQVLLQSRFQTPDLSIPVQQEAQEACCVDAGCGKENHFIREATGKQMSIYPL